MVNIAVLGFGVVGSGVVELCESNADKISAAAGNDVYVKYILDLRDFPDSPYKDRIVKDFEVILNDPEVSLIVECLGGSHPAYDFSLAALKKGKSVVSSNKETVAKFGHELLKTARENGVYYLFEASVGGGTPVIRPLSKCLAANRVEEVCGILNGTTNYILTMMNKYSESFATALASAQEKGYAERDPSDDINGVDTCRKICILTDIVTGKFCDPAKVDTTGITAIRPEDVKTVEKWGGAIKLLGRCTLVGDKYAVMVSPFVVSADRMIASVDNVFNAVAFKCDAAGDVTLCGRGAGKLPTASAMVSDVIDAVSGKAYRADWSTPEESREDDFVSPDDVADRFLIAFDNGADALARVNAEFGEVRVIDDATALYVMTEQITGADAKKHIANLEKLGLKSQTALRVLL
ncbi:MAG: homoserine dehydrogenase [Clostridia bacterium]|nr:homoserine dehydrogenase [Clostridia bacterium]